MRYGISAGALVVKEGRILLVHHHEAGKFDFWVPPGGKLDGVETIIDCASREAFEETGLRVLPKRMLYVEEFHGLDYHFCKFWFLCDLVSGELSTEFLDVDEGFLTEARYFTREEVQDMNIYPAIIKDGFWEDIQATEPATKYLGMQILHE